MNFFNKIKDSIIGWWYDEERERLAGLEEIRAINRQINEDQFNTRGDDEMVSDVFIRSSQSADLKEIGIERDGVLVSDKHPTELEFRIKQNRLRLHEYLGVPQDTVRFSKYPFANNGAYVHMYFPTLP